ncbi:hypothetical protein JY96_07280 [Aquabacterium sp. NJ1]|uniref:autotransporter outer membrane beta-barrel domain-containing protein n=1 Tax=Aquabacterium sp. NJ1 TaxID=1538295 RepID=UPI00052B7E58|nr:autotransporter outer membrane beta-barrel domain-containing protein [Aquabacterium sp. NJ1]KGM39899.1 hypothetical protein JY96_07280 [Aquabacterium sp. NJ1]
MLKSRSSLVAVSAALVTTFAAPVVTHAACSAYVTSIPTPPGDPSQMGSVTTTLRAATVSGTTAARRSQAAAVPPGWPESAPDAVITEGPPDTVVILPSSVAGSEPACASDAFGAPITAQSMRHARDRLVQTQNKLVQLRTLHQQAGGMQFHLTGSDQSRREGGDADAGTLALRVSRVDVNMGADYRFNDQWVAGGSFGLGNPRMRWDGNPARVDGQSGNLTAYGMWSPSPASFISAAFSMENTHYALHTEDDIEHETTGVNMGLSLSAGYDFQQGSWTISPYVRADEVAARIGSFGSESGRTRGRTGSVSAGSQVQTTVPTSWGLVAPHARLEFTQITGWHIQGDSAAAYAAGISVLPTPNPLALDRQFGTFGIGASAVLQRGLTLFTDYDTGFAQKAVSTWRLTFGLRSEL